MFKFSLGSFGAFPVFNDLVSTFHLNIYGSLYCYVYSLPAIFYLANDQAEREDPRPLVVLTQTFRTRLQADTVIVVENKQAIKGYLNSN